MGFFDLFKKNRIKQTTTTWNEFGTYRAQFSSFGKDIYSTSIVRTCIRPIADLTSKADIKCSDKQLERLLNNRPNMYMNGREFLKKVRTMYEIKNNVFIFIARDDRGKINSLYPIPYQSTQALEYNSRLFIKFEFPNPTREPLVVAWDDLAVLRKDYFLSDIFGDDNGPALADLELVNTTKQGLSNAIKATANLRGILKNTKAILNDEDIKKRQQQFIKDYMSLENEGGIASLDATQEFTPITMSPIVTTYTQMKEIRENIYKFFGVNDGILMGKCSPEELEAFCEIKIIPFLIDLGTELTSKIYAGKALAFDNIIIFNLNKLQFASTSTKLSMTALVDRGAMTPNEFRALFGLEAMEDGDEPIRRLDTASVDAQEGAKDDEANNNTDDSKENDTEPSSELTDENNEEGEEDGKED